MFRPRRRAPNSWPAHPGLRALLDAAALRSVRVRALEHGEKHIVDLYAGPGGDRQTVA